eukprot:9961715-Heterocapsa_arctica.AAC.1
MEVSKAMWPWLISFWRRPAELPVLPTATKPAGSQTPTGACTPSSLSNARSGEAVNKAKSPQAEPVSWKSMQSISLLARRRSRSPRQGSRSSQPGLRRSAP